VAKYDERDGNMLRMFEAKGLVGGFTYIIVFVCSTFVPSFRSIFVMIISAIVGLHIDAVAQRKLMDVPGPIFVPLKLTITLWL
jgi:hypothetical protein